MIDAKKFQQIVEEIAPLNYQYEWDNSGWNIFCHDEIERVITCLDVTDQIVEEAVEKGCDTIVPILAINHKVKLLKSKGTVKPGEALFEIEA